MTGLLKLLHGLTISDEPELPVSAAPRIGRSTADGRRYFAAHAPITAVRTEEILRDYAELESALEAFSSEERVKTAWDRVKENAEEFAQVKGCAAVLSLDMRVSYLTERMKKTDLFRTANYSNVKAIVEPLQPFMDKLNAIETAHMGLLHDVSFGRKNHAELLQFAKEQIPICDEAKKVEDTVPKLSALYQGSVPQAGKDYIQALLAKADLLIATLSTVQQHKSFARHAEVISALNNSDIHKIVLAACDVLEPLNGSDASFRAIEQALANRASVDCTLTAREALIPRLVFQREPSFDVQDLAGYLKKSLIRNLYFSKEFLDYEFHCVLFKLHAHPLGKEALGAIQGLDTLVNAYVAYTQLLPNDPILQEIVRILEHLHAPETAPEDRCVSYYKAKGVLDELKKEFSENDPWIVWIKDRLDVYAASIQTFEQVEGEDNRRFKNLLIASLFSLDEAARKAACDTIQSVVENDRVMANLPPVLQLLFKRWVIEQFVADCRYCQENPYLSKVYGSRVFTEAEVQVLRDIFTEYVTTGRFFWGRQYDNRYMDDALSDFRRRFPDEG